MTDPSRTRKAKNRPRTKLTPNPKILVAKLHARLDKERPGLERWHQRLVRTFHAYERQHRLVTRLSHRLAKLNGA